MFQGYVGKFLEGLYMLILLFNRVVWFMMLHTSQVMQDWTCHPSTPRVDYHHVGVTQWIRRFWSLKRPPFLETNHVISRDTYWFLHVPTREHNGMPQIDPALSGQILAVDHTWSINLCPLQKQQRFDGRNQDTVVPSNDPRRRGPPQEYHTLGKRQPTLACPKPISDVKTPQILVDFQIFCWSQTNIFQNHWFIFSKLKFIFIYIQKQFATKKGSRPKKFVTHKKKHHFPTPKKKSKNPKGWTATSEQRGMGPTYGNVASGTPLPETQPVPNATWK